MTVYIEKPAVNLREELASLRNQGGYQEQQFYFDGLVTNGTFDTDSNWTKGTGGVISGGVFTYTGGAAASAVQQPVSLNVGSVYEVTFDFTQRDGRTQVEFSGATAVSGQVLTTTGSYRLLLTNTSANTTLRFRSVLSTADFDIDNVSVFETDGTDVIHRLPKGWKPKDVFEDGLLQREGAAHDYEVVYDGFDYFVKPTVAPSATTQTCVIGVKA